MEVLAMEPFFEPEREGYEPRGEDEDGGEAGEQRSIHEFFSLAILALSTATM